MKMIAALVFDLIKVSKWWLFFVIIKCQEQAPLKIIMVLVSVDGSQIAIASFYVYSCVTAGTDELAHSKNILD